MSKVIFSLKNITKQYPGVLALDDVSLDLIQGEIHGLCGENGAGKSTLIKVISGAITPSSGELIFNGKEYPSISTRMAKDLGIEVIYQEFNLISTLTVAENLFLGDMPGKGAFVDYSQMRERANEVFGMMDVDINPDEIVENLRTAEMQLVEIAKALVKNIKILIMDEPTAPLTTHEVAVLYNLIRKLKEKGVTIIYISHRLTEIFDLTDRVTIMRDGKRILTCNTSEISTAELIRNMVGREMNRIYPERTVKPGKVVLEAKKLSGPGFREISFELHEGEILGFAGLIGAGRTETMRAIFGAEKKLGGELLINGESVEIHSPAEGIAHGIGFIPEDRRLQGGILQMSIKENITISILKEISRLGFTQKEAEDEIADMYKDTLKIKTPSSDQLLGNLSGGNQQKVIISKWLATKPRILIMDEPTRGIDVGAKQEIYSLMNELTEQGIMILVVMSEMEELLGIADRIIVLCEGSQMGELSKVDFDQDRILTLASGMAL